MRGERVSPRSEVIRAIALEDSPRSIEGTPQHGLPDDGRSLEGRAVGCCAITNEKAHAERERLTDLGQALRDHVADDDAGGAEQLGSDRRGQADLGREAGRRGGVSAARAAEAPGEGGVFAAAAVEAQGEGGVLEIINAEIINC